MQRKPTPGNNYHMVIRLIDDRPILIFPKSSQHQTTTFQNTSSTRSNITGTRAQSGIFETAANQTTSYHFLTHHKTSSCQINAFNSSDKAYRTQQTSYGQLKKTKDTDAADKSKCSFINQLCSANWGTQALTTRSEHFNGLESIQCIQSTSIHDGDSYDFDQADSEIISLTHEEKEFFQHFIEPQTEQTREIQELFKHLSLQSTEPTSKKIPERKELPQNKLKIIRNFFKPKEGIVNDQKTYLNFQSTEVPQALKINQVTGFFNQVRKL